MKGISYRRAAAAMGVRVSVITPVYNMEETIEASARSVLGQTQIGRAHV